MESKLMYKVGNLFSGYPYGVEVVKSFGSTELHGPFSSKNEAWNYGMKLANASVEWESFNLVKIETPSVKTIATAEEIRAHRERETAATQNLVADMERDGLL